MAREFSFEQGPIRPPNEAKSLLLRVTRNCPWNQCLFCPVYKRSKFSLRTVEEIKEDIQTAKDTADEIKALSWKLGFSGDVNDQVISAQSSTAPITAMPTEASPSGSIMERAPASYRMRIIWS